MSSFFSVNALFPLSAILFQSDNLLSYLTVEETLTYTAQLALRKRSAEAIKKKVTLELRLGISFIIFLNLASLPATEHVPKNK